LSPTALRNERFRRLHHGVWVLADVALTLDLRVLAARFALPPDAVVSHTTALAVLGVESAPETPLHFSTNTALRARKRGIVLHRRCGELHPREVNGVPVVGPDRAFVDSALLLSYRDLVRAGDALVRLGLTTPERLADYAFARHLDGVQRARRAVGLVRAKVDSVRETDLRLLLRFARLPEPEVNGWIVNDAGVAIARGDLVYRLFRVVVEYDGRHHESDPRQRQKDHLRRERLEAAGWTLITITAQDFKDPVRIVRRVHDALTAHGYVGAKPIMSVVWQNWFNAA
jgi:very-short-patch-repair endonuclease